MFIKTMLYSRKKQAGRPGLSHWIRTVLLLAVTAGITWYSQSDRNNPFTSRYIIEIGTRMGIPYVACIKDRFPETAEILFLPEDASWWENGSPAPFDSIRVLVTENRELSYSESLRIQEWLVPTCGDTVGIAGSSVLDPASRVMRVPQSFGRSEIRPLMIEGDSGCGVIIRFDEISLVYLDSSLKVFSEDQKATLRESFDLVVTNGSFSHTSELRNLLRPLQIVSIAPPDTAYPRDKRVGNISYVRVSNGMIQFHKDSRERLHVRRDISLEKRPTDDSSGFSGTTPTK